MVSDAELVERLREFLRCCDLSTTTTTSVRRRLEEDFGIDLSQKKGFIRKQVYLFMSELNEEEEEEEKDHDGLEVEQDAEEKVRDNSEAEKELKEEDDERGSAESDNGDEEKEEGEKEDDEENNDGKSSRKRKTKEISKEVKKRGGGFTKLCSLSPLLQDFVGETELARTEVVKRLWAYIREKNLQDPKNRRKIICDERLHTLFNVNSIDMFQMNKALSKHIWPLNSEEKKDAEEKVHDNSKAEKELKEEDDERGSAESDNGDEEEEGEKEDEDDEENNDGKSSRKRKTKEISKEVKKRGGGFTKLCSLSPLLQDFVGETELARTEVVKRLWAYIRERNLQDPKNRRKIICDKRLHTLFNVNSIDMFQMNKALSKHIWPLNSEESPVAPVKPKESNKKPKKESDGQRQKGQSGFLMPLRLSNDLIQFFGTGEDALSRADVVKRMWDYIKRNNLQDPADKKNVICDEKLKELLKVDSFRGFTVSKLLTPHFIKSKEQGSTRFLVLGFNRNGAFEYVVDAASNKFS